MCPAFRMSQVADTVYFAIAIPYRSGRKSRSDIFPVRERGATGLDMIRDRRYQAVIINLWRHGSSGTHSWFVEARVTYWRRHSLELFRELPEILTWPLSRYNLFASLCSDISGGQWFPVVSMLLCIPSKRSLAKSLTMSILPEMEILETFVFS